MISENLADQITALLMIGVGIGVAVCWFIGLVGIFKTDEIKSKYGRVIKGGWGLFRLFRTILNLMAFYTFCGNNLQRLAGYYVLVTGDNVFWYSVMILINLLFVYEDRKRFFSKCDKKTARKIIWAERELGFSMLTRLSLIITIPSMLTAFVMLDTSTYYYDENTGVIVRIKEDMSL